jgi:hypothetical protein
MSNGDCGRIASIRADFNNKNRGIAAELALSSHCWSCPCRLSPSAPFVSTAGSDTNPMDGAGIRAGSGLFIRLAGDCSRLAAKLKWVVFLLHSLARGAVSTQIIEQMG